MTTLAIMAQDIDRLALALVVDGAMVKEAEWKAPPERYLETIDRTMKEWRVDQGDFSSIWVVSGPGAFTASRASTTIANAIAFSRSIPIQAAENPSRMTLSAFISSGAFRPSAPSSGYAVPTYDRPPHITLPKRV